MGARPSPTTGMMNRPRGRPEPSLECNRFLKAVVVNSLRVTPKSAAFFLAFRKTGSSSTSVVLIHSYIYMQTSNVNRYRVNQPHVFFTTTPSASLGLVKIKIAGWREEEVRCRTRRERGSVVTALHDRKSNAGPAPQQPSPLGCRSFAAMLRCPREARPQGYCLSYAPRLTTKLLAPPPAFSLNRP